MLRYARDAQLELDNARRAAERLSSYRANPEAYLARRLAAGLPAVPPMGAEPMQVRGRVNRPAQSDASEPDPSALPGYKLHLSIDAITEAILELRAEKQRAARHNEDERIAIKSAFNRTFADVGLRLVNIPGWNRYERTIMEPRLA